LIIRARHRQCHCLYSNSMILLIIHH
jgi:hypothetical protein